MKRTIFILVLVSPFLCWSQNKLSKNFIPGAQDTINKDIRISVSALDNYLNNIADSLHINQTQFHWCKWKSFNSVFQDSSYTVLLEQMVRNDKEINSHGLSGDALKDFKTFAERRQLDSLSYGDMRRLFWAFSASKLLFIDTIYQGVYQLGMLEPEVSLEEFSDRLSYIKNFNSMHCLWIIMKSWADFISEDKLTPGYSLLVSKLQLMNGRLLQLAGNNYHKYSITGISNRKLIDVGMFTQNDMFVDWNISDFNRDMGYTGGLNFQFSTDRFKMRLIPWINGDHVLSYQQINVGFNVYTPYIRDTDSLLKLISYQHDRPFASTLSLGRTKFRVHRKGHIRETGKFELVIIGSNVGKYFQELLHKDFIVGSIKPLGWNNQISNGGRLGYTIYQKVDFLISSENCGFMLLDCLKSRSMRFFNPYLSMEGQLSHTTSFLGTSLNISNRNFISTSGDGSDFKLKPLQQTRVDYSLGFHMNYVIHNSLLGDFGMLKRAEDDLFDDEFLSNYFLAESLIRHWIWRINGQFCYHYKNSTLFYSVNLQRKEFSERYLDGVEEERYKAILTDRYNYKFYGWGTLGLIYNL